MTDKVVAITDKATCYERMMLSQAKSIKNRILQHKEKLQAEETYLNHLMNMK